MLEKTQALLAYIIQRHNKASVTVLMKLSYLIDLVNIKKGGKQITHYSYVRYNYGPFDNVIYTDLQALIEANIVQPRPDYVPSGEEYIVYTYNEDSEINFSSLSDNERSLADEVLENVKGYGARTLTEIAYKTQPMKQLGATLGGTEHIGEILNLSAGGLGVL
jgi:hypothetical protein